MIKPCAEMAFQGVKGRGLMLKACLWICRNHLGHTVVYLYGDGFNARIVRRNHQFNHASPRVEGFGLVENKVADAIIYGACFILFDGLKGVGVVANKEVGACTNQ